MLTQAMTPEGASKVPGSLGVLERQAGKPVRFSGVKVIRVS